MIKHNKRLVYKPGEKQTNISQFRGKSGVYILYSPAGKVRYIGSSRTQLYKTITRHFQKWNDSRERDQQVDYVYQRIVYPRKGWKVKIIETKPNAHGREWKSTEPKQIRRDRV